MSIENAREGLWSARRDLEQGQENAELGHGAADDTFSKYAEAEGHRNELLGQATALRLLVKQTETTLKDFSLQVFEAATLQERVDESSRTAGAFFALAKNHGISARTTLTEVLGAEDAAEYSPCVDYSTQAALHAANTAIRADAAERRLFEVANRLKALAQDFVQVTDVVFTATAAITSAGVLPADMEAVPMHGLRGQVANDPAAALENGTAATEAFGVAIQSVDERIDRLS